MSKATVRSGFDAWGWSTHPTLPKPNDKFIRLQSGVFESFLYFSNPVPRGVTVTRATLRLQGRGLSTGARTVYFYPVGNTPWSSKSLTWRNRPGGESPRIDKAITTVNERQVVEVDVTRHVQEWAAGRVNRGWKIMTSAGSPHYFYGHLSAYKPVLEIEWSDAPDKPMKLSPSNGGVVSVSHPIVSADYTDLSGNRTLTAVQVQVDPNANATAPAFDSGRVVTSVPQLDLAATAYVGLADGEAHSWRIRVQDGAGLWSAWSAWARFSRAVKPVVTLLSPSPTAGTVPDVTPTIIWSSSLPQAAYQVIVKRAGVVVFDSGKKAAADDSLQVSKVLGEGSHQVEVRVWDANASRVATPGDPTHGSGWSTFSVVTDPHVGQANGMRAVARGGALPWVDLSWTMNTAPDSWTIVRDGVVIEALLDPSELIQADGVTYRWTDYTAAPNRMHTYAVRAVVNGNQSDNSSPSTALPRAESLLLADSDRGVVVPIWGDDEGSWAADDDAAVYTPVGASSPVRIVSALRGLSGSLSGYLMEGFGRTFDELEADLYSIKERPSTAIRLVAGDMNLPVLIGNVVVSPTPITRDGQLVRKVAFEFWQVGEIPFDTRI